jgi:hypothetical protein
METSGKEPAIMVREPDATMQSAPQDDQLMSEHRILRLKPALRLERRRQNAQNETEQADQSASLGDSMTSSTRIRFSVHTPARTARHNAGHSSVIARRHWSVAYPEVVRPGTKQRLSDINQPRKRGDDVFLYARTVHHLEDRRVTRCSKNLMKNRAAPMKSRFLLSRADDSRFFNNKKLMLGRPIVAL